MKLEAADITAMDDSQKVAVLEALVTGVLCDGQVSAPEVAKFDEIVLALPWGMEQPVLQAVIKGTQQRVAGLKGPGPVMDFIAGLAARLTTPELRDKVLYTMASVMYADKNVNQLEKNTIGAFMLAFGVTTDRLAAIKAAVTGKP